MAITLTPPWHDLTFMSALSDERADRLAGFLAGGGPGTVVDVGCGWAELLLRVLALAPASVGVGVDLDTDAIEHGRRLAAERGLSDRVTLRAADAAAAIPGRAEALICVGATHVWSPPAGPDDPLHYEDALTRLRARLPRGGRLVYGEGIWSLPPTPAAVAALGGPDDEMIPLPELVHLTARVGFAVMAIHEATIDEWDTFESGFTARYARWLTEHDADHPDAAEVRSRAEQQHESYLRGYRGVLGLAYLELVAI